MKYNNSYSQVYPNYQLPQYSYSYTPNQSNSSIHWVQGEAAARAQFVDPGVSSVFFDSEDNLFYIKTSDVSGIPLPLRVFKYEEVTNNSEKRSAAVEQPDTSLFITKEEFEKRITELEKLIKKEDQNGKFII